MQTRYFLFGLALISLAGCRRQETAPIPPPRYLPTPGAPSASLYNLKAPILPNAQMTPGDVLEVTPQDFCTPGYSKKVRNVPSSVKKKVYLSYGIMSRQKGEYEVDHLISLQLGGSNSVKNLWPQSFKTRPWNARVKDALETRLHDKVCDGEISMEQAQREIATDWISSYKKHYNTQIPIGRHSLMDDDDAEDEAEILPELAQKAQTRRKRRKPRQRRLRTEERP